MPENPDSVLLDRALELERIQRAIEEVAGMVTVAEDRLTSGGAVRLDGLDVRMANILAAVERAGGDDLPPRLLAPLLALGESLERLEAGLKRLEALRTQPRRVAEAYGQRSGFRRAEAPPQTPAGAAGPRPRS